ncbi:winged helix-turn-helix transcriptional regulator [Hymenobacter cavernae]|uniref:winged helix-turn-helix transcriptional regulator n=1 Tax=Hymenobacter cavernae TaxID=2044852 RepID=UPI00166DCDF4
MCGCATGDYKSPTRYSRIINPAELGKYAYPEIRPRVEYELTASGQQALPVVDSIIAFGRQYL